MTPRPRAPLRRETIREAGAAALVALAAFLPFARGVAGGQSFYFRDLSLHFFPLRLFAVEGLRHGELRYWNPYVHAGEMLALPPLSYPLDLLQALLPDEAGFSLLLALHVPLAALAFFRLARGLGLRLTAAAAGALVYALGGFSLSSLNLYVYLHVVAWAPLVMLGLRRAAAGGPREAVLAAGAVAVAFSTTGVELALQAVVLGALLACEERLDRPAALRTAGALLLGLGLCGPTLAVLYDVAAGGARAAGFSADVVLAHSLHPLSLPQVLIANWHGDLAQVPNLFWGQNFFPRGFPYVLSLYLGASVLALAAVGALGRRPLARRLLLGACVALWVCLGRYGGWQGPVEALAALRSLRFPVKAFFSLHVCVALLAAFGLEELCAAGRSAWKRLAFGASVLGFALVAASVWPRLAPANFRWFLAGFLPPGLDEPARRVLGGRLLGDAASGGALALAVAALALVVLAGRLAPGRAAGLALAVAAADLLRAGAGLNPMVTPRFFELSPEMSAQLEALATGRIFTCTPSDSRAYVAARAQRAARGLQHDVWSFAADLELLQPSFNVPRGVRSAYTEDLTGLVPRERTLPPEEAACRPFGSLVERLRAAGVTHVLSLDPLEHPALRPLADVRPARLLPLAVHVFALEGTRPLLELAPSSGDAPASGRIVRAFTGPGRSEVEVESQAPAVLVEREAYAPGWSARVDGRPAPVRRVEGGFRGVDVPAGHSRVRLAFRPPHLALGLSVSLLSALLALRAWRRGVRGPLDRPAAFL